MNVVNDLDTQPWYKQGWPWALIAIPFLTVVAGVITFIIANDTSDSLVLDDYYKKGLAINSNIARLELAEQHQLTARIQIDKAVDLLTLKLTAQTRLPEQLSLTFSHPTLQKHDQSMVLSLLTDGEYVAEIKALEDAYWHVAIEDTEKTWLIKSRWLYPDIKELVMGHDAP